MTTHNPRHKRQAPTADQLQRVEKLKRQRSAGKHFNSFLSGVDLLLLIFLTSGFAGVVVIFIYLLKN